MLFTKEQIQLFASNPYTAYVSESVISYTAEFKEFFVESLKEGMSARQIFEAAGYDPKVLGNSRIKTFTCRIRKQADLGQEFRSGRKAYHRHPDIADYGTMSTSEAFRRMQNEILYLHQELEFLKKIISLDRYGGSAP